MTRFVDPRFGAELRSRREARGMSLRDLYAASHISKSLISEYENGRRRPSAETAAHLDQALGAGGALAALVVETEPSDQDTERAERIAHAARSPRRLDGAAVVAMGEVLAAHRRLDDTMSAPALVPIATAHHNLVSSLASQARGAEADGLHLVVAESLQFEGWLRARLGQNTEAHRLYAASAALAEELGAGGLASQSRRFRGSLAWEQGHAASMVRHYQHAAQTPGAGVLHRIDATIRGAHGLAVVGRGADALRALRVADDMATAAEGVEADQFAYWLSAAWLRFPLGLAYLELGQAERAAENLQAGFWGLPADQRETPWTMLYRKALVYAQSVA